jgi:hypothetical protein
VRRRLPIVLALVVAATAALALQRLPEEPGAAASASGAASSPAATAGFAVQVVERATRKPVPGAVVRAASIVKIERWRETYPGRLFDLEEPHPDVVERIADAEGRVRLPPSVLPGWCAARSGSSSGEVQVPLTNRVELEPGRQLAIQVVDAEGKPVAGVPLILARPGGGQKSRTLATRAPDGIALVRRVDRYASIVERASVVDVELAFPSRAEVAPVLRVDLGALTAEPVRLVLPPCGSVDVRLTGPRGEPLRVPNAVLRARPDSPTDAGGAWRSYAPAVVDEGWARFPFVGLGLDLEAVAPGNPEEIGGPYAAHGPKRAGEHVVLAVELQNVPRRVLGRVLGPDGAPRAGEMLVLRCESVIARFESSVLTDESGRFETSIHVAEDQLEGAVLRILSNKNGVRLEIAVTLPEPLPHGPIDLGDVTLGPPKPFARGVVHDDGGRVPIGIRLDVSTQTLDKEPRWRTDPRLFAVIGSDGRFELHGLHRGGPLRVHASGRGYVRSEPIDFTPPCGELEVRVVRCSAIEGRVVLDPGVETKDLSLELVPAGAGRDPKTAIVLALAADGTFRGGELAPGEFLLRILRKGTTEPLCVIDGLTLRPGVTALDARLDRIDLTGRVPPRDR